jgi:predicted nucleic acid-binding protein
MKKLKLYVETSVWGFLLDDDAPEKKVATEAFFKEIESGKYEIFISETVIAEIRDAPDERKKLISGLIEKYNPVILEEDEEVTHLTEMYISSGVLTRLHISDLAHLACASANGINALISWNLAHLVKMKTQDLGNSVNLAMGYHSIQIRTPQEVIEVED